MLVWSFGVAWAGEHEEPAEEAEEGALFAGRLLGEVLDEEGEAVPLAGAGLAAEEPLGHALALELAVGVLFGQESREIPVELVLEHPLLAGHRLEPYVGLGPSLVLVTDGAHPGGQLGLGGVALLGGHLWWSEHAGLLLEADADAVHRHTWSVGGAVLTGVAVRM